MYSGSRENGSPWNTRQGLTPKVIFEFWNLKFFKPDIYSKLNKTIKTNLKVFHWLEVMNSKFEHIHHLIIEHSTHNQTVWSLFRAESKQEQ